VRAAPERFRLRRARPEDLEPLHRLLCVPEIIRYLADNEPPPLTAVEAWLHKSDEDFARDGVGLWLLASGGHLGGCVRLEVSVQGEARTAEITYVLHPDYWGQGLATRMSSAAIRLAFTGGGIDRILAGADDPNEASFAVMERLGMRFVRSVSYPAGPGKEYELRRGDVLVDEGHEPLPIDA